MNALGPSKSVHRLACCASIVLHVVVACAQDERFSQPSMTPLLVDPALAGALHDREASFAHRAQWNALGDPFRSDALNVSMRGGGGATKKAHAPFRMAFGLGFLHASGGQPRWSGTQADLVSACHLPLDARSSIGAGLSLGFHQQTSDLSDGRWGSQYNGQYFDATRSSGEDALTSRAARLDAGIGVVYVYRATTSARTKTREKELTAGAAVYHLGQLALAHGSGSDPYVARLFSAFARGSLAIADRFALVPEVVAQAQGPHLLVQYGTALRLALGPQGAYADEARPMLLSFGAFHRPDDAMVAQVSIEWTGCRIGIAYDLSPPDPVRYVNGRRAIEFALSWALR